MTRHTHPRGARCQRSTREFLAQSPEDHQRFQHPVHILFKAHSYLFSPFNLTGCGSHKLPSFEPAWLRPACPADLHTTPLCSSVEPLARTWGPRRILWLLPKSTAWGTRGGGASAHTQWVVLIMRTHTKWALWLGDCIAGPGTYQLLRCNRGVEQVW